MRLKNTRAAVAAASLVLMLIVMAVCTAYVETREREASASAEESVRLPVLMYHSVLRDPARTGTYIITPARFEEDLIWLKANGYETVVVQDLLGYVSGEGELPEKPVMLTFDDGYLNNKTYILPLLEKYGCKAVIFVVGEYTSRFSDVPDPNPNYAHLTWADIDELRASGLVEIQNHSYALHSYGSGGRDGAKRLPGESDAAYAGALTADLARLQAALADNCGFEPTAFAYPFGMISGSSDEIIKNAGFQASFSCSEHVNTITRSGSCLFSLGRFNRAGQISTEKFMRRISG